MRCEAEAPGWEQAEEAERQRWEEEQEILEADPAYADWLTFVDQRTEETNVPKTSEMIVSKFLRKEDFDEDRILTIKGVSLEDMPGENSEQKWVLAFREEGKGMVMNITTIRVLEQAFGDDSDDWVGKRVMVYVDPNVSFGGKVVGGLRLRPPKKAKPGKAAPARAPERHSAKKVEPIEEEETSGVADTEGDDFDDDVPF